MPFRFITLDDQLRKEGVVAFFHVQDVDRVKTDKPERITVLVYRDTKVGRLEGGKRVPAKAEDLRLGQRLELRDAELERIASAVRIKPWTVVILGTPEKK